MNYESSVLNDTSNAALQGSGLVRTWTETRTFFDAGLDVAADASKCYLMQAFTGIDKMVQEGQPHYELSDAFCTSVRVEKKTTDSTTHVSEIITYMQPGPLCSVQCDAYQQTEVRTFATDNTGFVTKEAGDTHLTNVTYHTTLANIAQSSVPFVAQIRTPCMVRSVRVTQYEAMTGPKQIPIAISGPDKPFWNSDPVWGFKPGALLFIGVQSANPEGTPIYRRTYTFLVNQYGWHHFYQIYTMSNGLAPPDIVPIDPTTVEAESETVRSNGMAGFRMLASKVYADQFSHLKPPFNTASTNNGDIIGPDTTVIIPGNLA